MSIDNFGGTIDIGNTKSSIVLPNLASKKDNAYVGFFIKIVSGSTINIRTVTQYVGINFTASLDKPLTFDPQDSIDTYYISSAPNSLTTPYSDNIVSGSTSTIIKLPSLSSSTTNDAYKNQWIYFTEGVVKGHVRFISGYDSTTNTLTIESLPDNPNTGDAFSIYSEFMGEYIMFGFFDVSWLSGFVDSVGGIGSFEVVSCLFCVLLIGGIFLALTQVEKSTSGAAARRGLDIPGVGHLSPRQPLIIQLPMETKPYPFHDSVFPRNTLAGGGVKIPGIGNISSKNPLVIQYINGRAYPFNPKIGFPHDSF